MHFHSGRSSRTQHALQQDAETKGLNAKLQIDQIFRQDLDFLTERIKTKRLSVESNSQDRRSNPAACSRAPSESCEFGLYTFLHIEAAGNHLNNSNQLRNLVWFDFDGRKG